MKSFFLLNSPLFKLFFIFKLILLLFHAGGSIGIKFKFTKIRPTTLPELNLCSLRRNFFSIRSGSLDTNLVGGDLGFKISDNDENFELETKDFYSNEDDFGEESVATQFLTAWKNTPPLTKAYLTASITATFVGYFTNKNNFPKYFCLEWKLFFLKLQIWRPITAFLNFGPLNIGYIMTAHFVWTYMATLERLSHEQPYDFWLMIAFGCVSMLIGYFFLNISPRFLGHNLSTYLVYVWSRYHEGLEVSMFELFNTRAEMLPWFFLAQTFLLEGEFPVLDLLGIAFGHIYHHLKITNVLQTPPFVIDWYNGDGPHSKSIREKYKKISLDYEIQ